MKRSNVIIYMVSTSRELYHAGSVVNIASISAEHFQRPPEDLYSDQEAPGPLGTHRDLTMRGSVVIGLLRGQGLLKRKIYSTIWPRISIGDVYTMSRYSLN